MPAAKHPYLIRPARPEEEDTCWEVERAVWAPFNWMAEGGVGLDYVPGLHFVAVDEQDNIVATVDGCPFDWDGNPAHLPDEGWRDVNVLAQQGFAEQPRYACALGTSILAEARGGGLAGDLLVALKEGAAKLGYQGLLAPVRPTSRASMPHLDITEYAAVRLADGRHYDPWLRIHEAIGGSIISTSERSMYWWGVRPDWEDWLGLRLPDNGSVLVPGSTGWLELTDGFGELVEDSVWVLHPITQHASEETGTAEESLPSLAA